MEVIVQEIARRVREALSISDEDKEAMKLAEAEIMAVVNSGQVIDVGPEESETLTIKTLNPTNNEPYI